LSATTRTGFCFLFDSKNKKQKVYNAHESGVSGFKLSFRGRARDTYTQEENREMVEKETKQLKY